MEASVSLPEQPTLVPGASSWRGDRISDSERLRSRSRGVWISRRNVRRLWVDPECADGEGLASIMNLQRRI